MRIWSVIAAVISLVAGAPARAVEESNPGTPQQERSGDATGYRIQTDEFYIWDEDRETAEQWSEELAASGSRRSIR